MAVITQAEFKNEVNHAKTKQCYNIELIVDYLQQECLSCVNYSQETVASVNEALPIIDRYIMETEQQSANIMATYKAALLRASAAEGKTQFWQATATGLAFVTVVYCAFRTIIWYVPQWDFIKVWLDRLF